MDKDYWLWFIVMAILIATGMFFPLLIIFFILAAFKCTLGSSHISDNNAHNDGAED